jgi:hypothetical protein
LALSTEFRDALPHAGDPDTYTVRLKLSNAFPDPLAVVSHRNS